MKRSYLTLKQMAEVLKISENEVLELCKKKQIPHEIADKGTVWEAYIFIEKDVLTALEGREIKEEEPQPEPEQPTEEEATSEPKEPVENQSEGPEAEQSTEQTEDEKTDPFEKAKEEEPKK